MLQNAYIDRVLSDVAASNRPISRLLLSALRSYNLKTYDTDFIVIDDVPELVLDSDWALFCSVLQTAKLSDFIYLDNSTASLHGLYELFNAFHNVSVKSAVKVETRFGEVKKGLLIYIASRKKIKVSNRVYH